MKNNTLNILRAQTPEMHSRSIRRKQEAFPKTKEMKRIISNAHDALKNRIALIEKKRLPFAPHKEFIEPKMPVVIIHHSYDEYHLRESFRATSLEGATKALNRRNKGTIVSAIFTDNNGIEKELIN